VVRPCMQAAASTVECMTAEGREERTLALSRWMSSSSLRFLRMFIRLLDSARRRAAAVVTASICQLTQRVPQRTRHRRARDTRHDRGECEGVNVRRSGEHLPQRRGSGSVPLSTARPPRPRSARSPSG
jgi:hypothetical protein